jgi:hypothetical protein
MGILHRHRSDLSVRGSSRTLWAGPKTAALFGFIYGIVGYVLPNLGQAPLGLFPVRLWLITTLVGLIEVVVASIGGAWLYRE